VFISHYNGHGIKLVRPLSTVDNTRDYARVSHSRQWSNYNYYGSCSSEPDFIKFPWSRKVITMSHARETGAINPLQFFRRRFLVRVSCKSGTGFVQYQIPAPIRTLFQARKWRARDWNAHLRFLFLFNLHLATIHVPAIIKAVASANSSPTSLSATFIFGARNFHSRLASRFRLRSANRQQLLVPRCRLDTYVGLSRSLVRPSGTRYLTNLKTRRLVLTVLNSSLRQSCSVSIVTSALEVFLKRYALYKFTFYLLFYLLYLYGMKNRHPKMTARKWSRFMAPISGVSVMGIRRSNVDRVVRVDGGIRENVDSTVY